MYLLFPVIGMLLLIPSYATALNVSGTISQTTTWALVDSPINVIGDVYVYGTNEPLLYIEPGVEVKFNSNCGLYLGYSTSKGGLRAIGTASQPIKFTGSTNASNTWEGITFNTTADIYSTMDYCIVSNAGQYGNSNYGNIIIENSRITVIHSTITSSYNYGMIVTGTASPLISSCTFSGNGSYGLYITGTSSPTVTACYFTGNNTPVNMIPTIMLDTSNTFGTNTNQRIELNSGTIKDYKTWFNHRLPYYVAGNISIDDQDGFITKNAVLTIQPGVTVQFTSDGSITTGNSTMGYNGILIASGTSGNPITFSNNTGTSGSNWRGLIFNQYSDGSALSNCIIEYGGYNGYGNIYCNSKAPAINDCVIRNSAYYGIYNTNAPMTVYNSTITLNTTYGMYISGASGITISSCVVSTNGTYGMYMTSCGDALIKANKITGNGSYPLSVSPEINIDADNVITGNSNQEIEITQGTINGTCIWSKLSGLVYNINGTVNVYDVDTSNFTTAKLIIQPGVVLKFSSNGQLNIGNNSSGQNGIFIASGTVAEPITFTSNATSPTSASWRNIVFSQYAGTSTMSYCNIEYAGYNGYGSIYCYYNSASVVLRNCLIKQTNYGIYSSYGKFEIYDSTVSYCSSIGIYAANSNSIISRNKINLITSYGIQISAGESYISGNTISDITGNPIAISAATTLASDNVFTNYGGTELEVSGGVVSKNTTWANNGFTYKVTGDVSIYDNDSNPLTSAVLTIMAGVTVNFGNGVGITVGGSSSSGQNGALRIAGVELSSVTLTATNPVGGSYNWEGITFNNYADYDNCVLEYCVLRNAGYGGNSSIVYVNYSTVTLRNCVILNSYSYGIGSNNGHIILDNSIIENCASYGLYCAAGTGDISNTVFRNNATYPVYMPCTLSLGKGNTYIGNTYQFIYVAGGLISTTAEWSNQGIPYYVQGTVYIYDQDSASDTYASLTINPGTKVGFNSSAGIQVGYSSYENYNGALIVRGTEDSIVELTRAKDYNSSLTATTWNGIYFYRGTMPDKTYLDYCKISYASNYNIYAYYCPKINITNCAITNSSSYGIYAYGYNASEPCVINITSSTFKNNYSYDIYAYYYSIINAANNYWGSATGPVKSKFYSGYYSTMTYNPYLTEDSFGLPRPGSFIGTSISTNTIVWTWTTIPEATNGYYVYNDANSTISSLLSAGTTIFTETGLSSNSQYARYVKPYNMDSTTRASSKQSVYTLATEPSALTGFSGSTSVMLTWTGDGSRYTVLASSGSQNGPWYYSASYNKNLNITSHTVYGLYTEADFWFKVAAYNGDGVLSGYTDTIKVMTGPGLPGVPYSSEGNYIKSTSITFNWTKGAANTALEFELQIGTFPGGASVVNTKYTVSPSTIIYQHTISGAQQNVVYYARVRAKNSAGVYGEWASSDGVVYDTVKPVLGTLYSDTHPSSSVEYMEKTVSLNWLAATDTGSGVDKYYYILDHNELTAPTTASSSLGSTESIMRYYDLADGTWYFHLAAADKTGNFTTSPKHFMFKIKTTVSSSADNRFITGDGAVIEIPSGAVSNSVQITITTPSTLNNSSSKADGILTFTNFTKNITLSGGVTSFNKKIKIVIPYTDSGLPAGVKAYKLKLAYYSTTTSLWTPIKDSTVDTTNKTVTAYVDHLTEFRVIEYQTPLASTAYCYPNPFNAGSNTIILYTVPGGDTANYIKKVNLKIYDLLGGLVWSQEYTGGETGAIQGVNNEVVWDGKNGKGEMVTAGAYIVYINTSVNATTAGTSEAPKPQKIIVGVK